MSGTSGTVRRLYVSIGLSVELAQIASTDPQTVETPLNKVNRQRASGAPFQLI